MRRRTMTSSFSRSAVVGGVVAAIGQLCDGMGARSIDKLAAAIRTQLHAAAIRQVDHSRVVGAVGQTRIDGGLGKCSAFVLLFCYYARTAALSACRRPV